MRKIGPDGQLERMICNACGKKLAVRQGIVLEGAISIDHTWDYFSEKDGIVAGYCALRVLADEGEIQRIAVLPSWRRHGIAKSLMEAMIQVSKEKGAVQMSLEVRESNTGARKLYENYGFIQEAVRKNYYENPVENACIMWKHEL